MYVKKFIQNSLITIDSELHSMDQIINFFDEINSEKTFKIKKIGVSNLKDWDFDRNGDLSHVSKKFFKVTGVNHEMEKTGILLQNGIGTLGLLSCILNETMYFLIQFKKEPGNTVTAQLSPTLQATISNQKKVHGGSQPEFLEEFLNATKQEILISRELPEQGNRYWRKFNKNTILVKNYFDSKNNFKWMTLGQILMFSEKNDSINSCLRSVLSLIDVNSSFDEETSKKEKVLNIIEKDKESIQQNSYLRNSVKEFYEIKSDRIYFKNNKDSYYIDGISVTIEGREVQNWDQPIIFDPFLDEYSFVSLLMNEKRYYLLKKYTDPGYVDGFCYGPTFVSKSNVNDNSFDLLLKELGSIGVAKKIRELRMSEEGGRFYQTSVKHSYYEIVLEADNFTLDGWSVFDETEIQVINNLGYLNMEARSLLFLSNTIFLK